MTIVFLLVVIDCYASDLIQANASHSKENGTILVLKFDRNQPISIEQNSGRELTLFASGLVERNITFQRKGYVRQLDVQNGRITIQCSRYVKVKLIPAGTGIYILHLQLTNEPSVAINDPNLNQSTTQTQPDNERQYEDQQKTTDRRTDNTIEETPVLENVYRDVNPSIGVVVPATIKLAIQLASEGESGRAIALLNSIQTTDPDFPWSRFAIGKIYEQNGEISRALDKYRQALIYPETESIAAVHIALAFQSMGNSESAISMWERVLELSGGHLTIPEGEPETAQMEVINLVEEKQPFLVKFRLYLIILGIAILLAASVFLFFFFKNRSKKMGDLDEFGLPSDMYDEDSDVEESVGPKVAKMYADQQDLDDDDDDIDSQIAELDKMVEDNIDLDSDDLMENTSLSDTKVKKVQTLHEQGATVREIAETLGLGQDEVRMAINLSEA